MSGTEINDNVKKAGGKAEPIFFKDIKFPLHVYDPDLVVNGYLCVGYSVKKLSINGKLYNGTINERYCPHCKKPLLEESGKMPVFTVAMIGHSTAGKTVFLTMQHYAQLHGLFNEKIHNINLEISWRFSHLTSRDEDIVRNKAVDFENRGEFPPTTQMTPPPHCLMVETRRLNGSNMDDNSTTTCILCFRDVVGEGYTGGSGIEDITKCCRRADALFVLTDPFSLNRPRHEMPGRSNMNIESLSEMENILSVIFKDSTGTAVNKPTACLLTKVDGIYDNYENMKIEQDEPAIAGTGDIKYFIGRDKNWATQFYKPVTASAENIVSQLDSGGNWYKILRRMFTSAAYIPVSSIGCDVKIFQFNKNIRNMSNGLTSDRILVSRTDYDRLSELNDSFTAGNEDAGKKLLTELEQYTVPINSIHPRFIELPMLYLLTKFKMIPPIMENIYAMSPEKNFNSWYDSCAMIYAMNDEEQDFQNRNPPKFFDGSENGLGAKIKGFFGKRGR